MIISYELVDDALCDLDDTLDYYEDCTQCPLFYDCMNVVESEDKNERKNFSNECQIYFMQINIYMKK